MLQVTHVLSNIIDLLMVFKVSLRLLITTCVLYFLAIYISGGTLVITTCFIFSCHFHIRGTLPDSVFRVLQFRIFPFHPIMRLHKSVFRISCSRFTIQDVLLPVLPFRFWCSRFSVLGFTISDLVFQHSVFHCFRVLLFLVLLHATSARQ